MYANPCIRSSPLLPFSEDSAAARWHLRPARMHAPVAHLISCRCLPAALLSRGISCPAVALRAGLSFSQLSLETEAPFCLPTHPQVRQHRDSWVHGTEGLAGCRGKKLCQSFSILWTLAWPGCSPTAESRYRRYPFARLRVDVA